MAAPIVAIAHCRSHVCRLMPLKTQTQSPLQVIQHSKVARHACKLDLRCKAAFLEQESTLNVNSTDANGAENSVQAAKARLLASAAGTQRGSEASPIQRGLVEEAQIAVESFAAGTEIQWELLAGMWNLVYTTASDVKPIVKTGAGLPGFPITAHQVSQRFTSPEQGIVQNIIDVTLLAPVIEKTTVRFVVEASYVVRTARSIALTFQSAGVENIQLGASAQNLIAPALLPRGWLNQQILMAIEELKLTIPISTRSSTMSSSTPAPVGINYLLTYLDEDMLIGRAQGGGGVFIFVRGKDE